MSRKHVLKKKHFWKLKLYHPNLKLIQLNICLNFWVSVLNLNEQLFWVVAPKMLNVCFAEILNASKIIGSGFKRSWRCSLARPSEWHRLRDPGCFPDSGAKSPLPVSSSSVAAWAAAAEGHPFEACPRRPPTGWVPTPWRRLTTSGGRVCTTSAFRRSGLETDRDAPRAAAAAVVAAGAAEDTASFRSSAWSRRTWGWSRPAAWTRCRKTCRPPAATAKIPRSKSCSRCGAKNRGWVGRGRSRSGRGLALSAGRRSVTPEMRRAWWQVHSDATGVEPTSFRQDKVEDRNFLCSGTKLKCLLWMIRIT